MNRPARTNVEATWATDLVQAILREVDETIVALDDAGRVRLVGAGAEALFGYPADELIGQPFADICDGAMFGRGGRPSPGRQPSHVTERTAVLLGKDGRRTTVQYRVIEVWGDGDASSHTLVVMRKLDKHDSASPKLTAYPHLAAALRGSGIGFWIADVCDGPSVGDNVQLFNFWEHLGYDSPPGSSGMPGILELAHPDDLDSVRRGMNPQFIGRRRKHYLEARYRHRDGSYRWLLQRSYTEYSTTGIPVRLAGSSVDITERVCAEAALREANAVVAAANSAKDRFIASIGHELRTPLNGILGYAHLLRIDSTMTPRQQHAVAVIERNGDLLLSLINDILDVASIESGKGQLNVSRFSTESFLRMLCGLIRLRLSAKGLSFVCRLSSDLPAELDTDEGRLHRVLVELVTHCASRVQNGQVSLDVSSYDNRSVRFEITHESVATGAGDDGKGPDAHTNRSAEGLDASTSELALEISGRMAALLDRRNRFVQETSGRGDSFRFEVPAAHLSPRVERILIANGHCGAAPSVLVIGSGHGVDALMRVLRRLRFAVHQRPVSDASAAMPDEVDALICAGAPQACAASLTEIGARLDVKHTWYLVETGTDDVSDARAVAANLVDRLGIQLTLEDTAIACDELLSDDTALLVHPPAEEVGALYAHALSGNMREVLAWVESMRIALPAFSAFSMRVRDYARHYDSQALVAFVERYLPDHTGKDYDAR